MINAILGLSLLVSNQTSTELKTISSLAEMTEVNAEFLGNEDQSEIFEITTSVKLGNNPCEAEDVSVELIMERVETVTEVYALKTSPAGTRFCTREYRPVYQLLSIKVDIDHRSKDILIRNVVTENGLETISFREFLPLSTDLTSKCDTEGKMFAGGSPLFNEMTGEYMDEAEYLENCGN